MKKVSILMALATGLMLAFSAQALKAQQLTTYTPSLELVSKADKAGHSVFTYRLTGDAAERTQYGTWLRELKPDPNVINALEVSDDNTTCTVTLDGIGSAERGQLMLQEFDRVLRMRDAALSGPNRNAEMKLHQEHARAASSVPSQH